MPRIRDIDNHRLQKGCEQCEGKGIICESRATALQCGHCPSYVKCTRIAAIKKLRMLDIMHINEEQYDWLLCWFKKTAEAELLKPLEQSLLITDSSSGTDAGIDTRKNRLHTSQSTHSKSTTRKSKKLIPHKPVYVRRLKELRFLYLLIILLVCSQTESESDSSPDMDSQTSLQNDSDAEFECPISPATTLTEGCVRVMNRAQKKNVGVLFL